MGRKTVLIIFFIIINIFTLLLSLKCFIVGQKTIKISEQNDYIVLLINEKFDIDYNIKKVRFRTGFPDGYYLDLYNGVYMVETVFDDNHEDSKICDYFDRVENSDATKYLFFFIIEILIEVLVIDKLKRIKDYNELENK